MLEIGTIAPGFTLPDQNGDLRSLFDYRGKKVVMATSFFMTASSCSRGYPPIIIPERGRRVTGRPPRKSSTRACPAGPAASWPPPTFRLWTCA